MADALESTTGLLDVPVEPAAAETKGLSSEDVEPAQPPLSIDDLLSLPIDSLTLQQVTTTLSAHSLTEIPPVCLRLISKDIRDLALARGIISFGLSSAATGFKAFEAGLGGAQLGEAEIERAWQDLQSDGKEKIRQYVQLSSLRRKLDVWGAFAGPEEGLTDLTGQSKLAGEKEGGAVAESVGKDAELELDDPWAEEADKAESIEIDDDPWNDNSSEKTPSHAPNRPSSSSSDHKPVVSSDEEPPIPLSTFLHQPILQSALEFASAAFLPGLRPLLDRYSELVHPVRLALAQSCPDWISPAELGRAGLLPTPSSDGTEDPHSKSTADISPAVRNLSSILKIEPTTLPELPSSTAELSPAEITDWYISHILSLDTTGQVDLQLSWVQHAESTGVSGVDELGEDLSLLSRLVYESDLTPTQNEKWSLETWRSSTSTEIISAYLSNSSPSSITPDLKSRVLPYLYVLESRAERAGRTDPNLIERYLCETILSLPLSLALPIFEASKATLSKSQRIIKDDLNVARLALACLYGSDQRDVWGIMSAIFECLPVWELSGRDPMDDAELTSTTLESIAAFIRPTASQPSPPKAVDLMMFFQPLPFASLSRALDILDVHLESGEILARWDVPVQLRFLLQSSRDTKEQVELAERMVRKAALSGVKAGLRGPEKTRLGGGGGEEGKWARLWDDMLRLNGSGDQLLRGAFGMVDGGELMRVYLGGLLRSGKLDMARKTVRRLEAEHNLKTETLEAVVLATSRELYEGAENGNIHTGDMKVAYDCLTIAQQTPPIQTERAFIEATSRLSTFSLPSLSPHGGSLSPQEIRHTKHRLDLLSSVLTHSPDAFRHEQMLLDLATKLGVGSRIEKGRVWGMMAGIAAERGEWEIGDEYVAKAAEVVKENTSGAGGRGRKKASDPEAENSQMARLRQDVRRTAMIIGSSDEYSDIGRKMDLLGLAVELCPPEEVEGVLGLWRKVEDGRIKLDQAAKRRRLAGIPGGNEPENHSSKRAGRGHTRNTSTSSSNAWSSPKFDLGEIMPSGGAEEDRVLGSRTAARAAKMAFDIGGRLGSRIPPIPLQLPRSASPSTSGYSLSRSVSRAETGSASGRSTSAERREGEGGGGVAGRVSGEYSRALDAIASLRGGGGDGEHPAGEGQALGMEDVERVRRGAQRALRSGVGWLLGADESEI